MLVERVRIRRPVGIAVHLHLDSRDADDAVELGMIQGLGRGRTGQGCGAGGGNQSSQGLVHRSAGRCSPAGGGAHLCRA
jgi:hypothetical protein